MLLTETKTLQTKGWKNETQKIQTNAYFRATAKIGGDKN
jgi:hypothetical protein